MAEATYELTGSVSRTWTKRPCVNEATPQIHWRSLVWSIYRRWFFAIEVGLFEAFWRTEEAGTFSKSPWGWTSLVALIRQLLPCALLGFLCFHWHFSVWRSSLQMARWLFFFLHFPLALIYFGIIGLLKEETGSSSSDVSASFFFLFSSPFSNAVRSSCDVRGSRHVCVCADACVYARGGECACGRPSRRRRQRCAASVSRDTGSPSRWSPGDVQAGRQNR